ncbi:hypothetical protein BMS3Abin02_01240 [bacterium BMS3Abin02]|nr:hypothetical protein BMS3Abin02_01240 [bacterium BMS3Abin02]GBE22672.1 hypothetical protein BMS3Bbin01_02048 [bacterium BMS3Bbin01]
MLGVRENALLVRDTEVEKTSVSESKAGTAPNYKGGFGFHRLFCFADATGGSLSEMGRVGNAAANDMVDLLTVVDDAITHSLPM